MSLYNRENQYITLLSHGSLSVKELSKKLFISEPTVRRDIILLQKKNLVSCNRGIVNLKTNSPDQRIPLFIRELEQNEEKQIIATKAASHIKDGYAIMIDHSTTAYYLLPHLIDFKNILVITNGAKTALESASFGFQTICAGGQMTLDSFSYIGYNAEETLRQYNADIAFFSCRGITDDGIATDNSIYENNIRKIMIQQSKQSYLLCDKKKFGKIYLNTLCNIKDIDGLISD